MHFLSLNQKCLYSERKIPVVYICVNSEHPAPTRSAVHQKRQRTICERFLKIYVTFDAFWRFYFANVFILKTLACRHLKFNKKHFAQGNRGYQTISKMRHL